MSEIEISTLTRENVEKYKSKITEFRTADQAQKALSPYSVFNLVYDGKLFADHYISGNAVAQYPQKRDEINIKFMKNPQF